MFSYHSNQVKLLHIEQSVEQAIELVRRNALTQMDGRDLARILALESNNDTHCYTVSLEQGATYTQRHMTANFNRPSFCQDIKQTFGRKIQFRQIILDYFWMPGSWQASHWKAPFFHTTLPNFVNEGMIDFRHGVCDENDNDSFSSSGKGGGVVYLPFCLHCVQQIIAAYDILKEYYTIEFMKKDKLDQHALWAATSTIDPDSMQNWLGKNINQEDVYCRISNGEVFGSTIDPNVTKEELLCLLRKIEDFDDVRMIKLKVLQMYNPSHPEYCGSSCKNISTNSHVDNCGRNKEKKLTNANNQGNYKQKEKKMGVSLGGFIGLVEDCKVKNGFDNDKK